jgi:hypothetical protein
MATFSGTSGGDDFTGGIRNDVVNPGQGGLGKIGWLEVELGDAIDLMRAIKRASTPTTWSIRLNPGKIFRR